MNEKAIELDFTFAKNALYVRQTLAAAFGVPLGQEFTWDSLSGLVCNAACATKPSRLTVSGLSNMAVRLPEEAAMFRGFMRDVQERLPNLDIRIVLHD